MGESVMNGFFQRWVVFGLLGCFGVLVGDEGSRQRYLELIKQYPGIVTPRGDASRGEIEIILDEEQMALIEKKIGRDVGVVKEDRYWIWINDACRFPSGNEGVYGRIFWVRGIQSSSSGVAVMPVTAEGKVVLNCNFRHATRSWEIELPRGLVNEGEMAEAAARREAAEETGRMITEIRLLGEMPPDTGVLSVVVPVFIAKVASVEAQQQEETEAIEEILELSIEEVKKAFAVGYYECELRGQRQKVFCRDPFLAYALLQYSLEVNI
jgi:ADP-ribose pyrophosphatase